MLAAPFVKVGLAEPGHQPPLADEIHKGLEEELMDVKCFRFILCRGVFEELVRQAAEAQAGISGAGYLSGRKRCSFVLDSVNVSARRLCLPLMVVW